MLEYSARITSQEPVTDDLRADIHNALSDAASSNQLITSLQQNFSSTNEDLEKAYIHINNIASSIASSRTYAITSSGYVSCRVARSCPNIQRANPVQHTLCNPPSAEPQIRLTLHSDFEQLQQELVSLSSRLSLLEGATRIRPIPDHLRKQGSTLYPQYGDWLLTSYKSEQGISFGGLSAEIGKSIYIQTRRQAYLYVNGHSFYGLSSVSTSQDQWLSSNTTYRFVRYSSTTWLVTASSSPYPLT